METLQEVLPSILDGFSVTLRLLVPSLVACTVVGTVLAGMRVSPVAPLRAFGTSYVNLFRNTPLIVLFILVVEGFPQLGIRPNIGLEVFPEVVTRPDLGLNLVGMNIFQVYAVVALSIYTSAFVCEAVRSGINTVDPGQAEAARSVGMTFGQSLAAIVLPQAFRAVVPPLASVYIALAKNTSVAAAFGVLEATGQLSALIEDGYLYIGFFGIAAGYILVVAVISTVAAVLERRLAVAR